MRIKSLEQLNFCEDLRTEEQDEMSWMKKKTGFKDKVLKIKEMRERERERFPITPSASLVAKMFYKTPI